MQLIHTLKNASENTQPPIIDWSQSRANIFQDIILHNVIERVATLPKAGELLNQLMQKCIIRSAGAEITKTQIMVAKTTKSATKFWVCSLYLQFLSECTRLKLTLQIQSLKLAFNCDEKDLN